MLGLIVNNQGLLLFQAIKENDEAQVKSILNSSSYPAWSEVHDKNKPQSQIDIFGSESPSATILESLFARYGLQIFGYNNSREALHWAAARGYLTVVTFLLEKGGVENVIDKGVALEKAALKGHLGVVTLLLEKYAEEINDYSKGMALLYAAGKGHIGVVTLLLEKCGTQISDADKRAAIQDAARFGHLLNVASLLEKCGAQISAASKGSALRQAASWGHLDIVNLLLKKCGTQISDEDKALALKAAAKEGQHSTVEALLADASVTAVASWNDNAALKEAQTSPESRMPFYAPSCQLIAKRLLQIPAVAQLAQHQQQDSGLAEGARCSLVVTESDRPKEPLKPSHR